jgi:PAS domain S-box-containing protein
MTAGTKKPKEKNPDPPPGERSLRDSVEEQLARSLKPSPEMKGKTLEQFIYELQVHQIELEVQAEELRRAQLALEESRDKFLELYDFAPTGYLTLTDKVLIAEVNLAGATLLGVERSKLINKRFRKFIAPEFFEQWDQYFVNLLRQEEKQTCTLTLKRSDGSTVPTRMEGIQLSGRDKSITIRIAISDISDIWQIAALRASEEKFRGIFDTINDGIHINTIEPDGKPGKFIEVNEVACRMLQYTKEELLEHGPLDLVSGYHSRPLPEIIRELSSIGHSIFETEHRRKDGTIVPVEINAHVVSLLGNRMSVSVVRDITERKRAEEALKESERFISNIVEHIPDMIFVKDARDLRFVQLNKSGEDLLGYSRAEILGKNDFDLFPNDEALFFTGNDRQVLLTNQLSDNPEEKILTRYKGERILHTKKIPIVDEKGVPQFLLGISEDITERKQIQGAMQESERKYRNLYMYAQMGLFETSFKDGTIIACNERYATLAGFSSAEDAIGKDIIHLYEDPDDRKEISRILHQEGHIDDHIIRLKNHQTGNPFLAKFSARFNHEKNVAEGSIIDITGRKQEEEALAESRQQIIFSLNAAEIGAWGLDLVKHTAWRTLRHDQIFGYIELLPEWTYEMFLNHVLLEDRSIVETKFGQALKNFSNWEFECRIRRKDGAICWIWAKGRPEFNDLHEPKKMFGLVQDITRRKRAEESLKESETKYRRLLNVLNEGIWSIDKDSVTTFVNPCMEEMLGYSVDEMLGRSLFSFMDEPARKIALAKVEHRHRGIKEQLDFEFLKKDGTRIYVVLEMAPIIDSEGSYIGAIAGVQDITERKAAEEAIIKFSEDLEHKVVE